MLIYGLPTASLPLPARLPGPQTLAQITRAIHGRRKLRVSYRSLSGPRAATRCVCLEPHTLVNTGLRWHVRAYSEDTCDFRDFVLSRIVAAECLDAPAESGEQYDDDWVEWVSLQLAPHSGLDAARRESLLLDYGASGEVIEVKVRRALLGYVLQRLSVDTTPDHSLNPNAYQLMLLNRDEIEPFAAWAFRLRDQVAGLQSASECGGSRRAILHLRLVTCRLLPTQLPISSISPRSAAATARERISSRSPSRRQVDDMTVPSSSAQP